MLNFGVSQLVKFYLTVDHSSNILDLNKET